MISFCTRLSHLLLSCFLLLCPHSSHFPPGVSFFPGGGSCNDFHPDPVSGHASHQVRLLLMGLVCGSLFSFLSFSCPLALNVPIPVCSFPLALFLNSLVSIAALAPDSLHLTL